MEPRLEKCCEAQASKGKVLYFEWARCLGAAAVVMIHVTSGIMDNYPISEVGVIRALVWSEMQVVLLRWAVPVFFMITGALLLDPDKEIGWKKIGRYVKRMALVLCTWGLAFCVLQRVFMERSISPSLIVCSVIDLLSNKGFSHLWYVYDLIGIYLMLPMLRAWTATSGDRDQRTLLAVLFVFTCVVPTINTAFGLELSIFLWLSSSVFYVMLGYYVHNKIELDKRVMVMGIMSLVTCMALKAYGVVVVGEYWKWLHGPACPLEAAWSVCVFLIMKHHLDRTYSRRGVIERVASLSLGIYVVHPLFINLLYKALGIGPWGLPPVVFETAGWGTAFFGSLTTVIATRHLPVVREVL